MKKVKKFLLLLHKSRGISVVTPGPHLPPFYLVNPTALKEAGGFGVHLQGTADENEVEL